MQVPWRICVSLIMAAVHRFVITCVTWKFSAAAGLVTTSLMTPKPALVSNGFLVQTSMVKEDRLVNIQNKLYTNFVMLPSLLSSMQQPFRAILTFFCLVSRVLSCQSSTTLWMRWKHCYVHFQQTFHNFLAKRLRTLSLTLSTLTQ